MIWLLLACTNTPPAVVAPVAYDRWTREAALAPVLVHADTDKDGRVTRPEYDRLAYRAPAFDAVDTDGDGALGVAELDVLVRGQDPVTLAAAGATAAANKVGFDDKGGTVGASSGTNPAEDAMAQRRRGADWAVMMILREEVLARDSAAAVPTVEEIAGAANEGLASARARTVLSVIEGASTKAGLGFPGSLKQK